MIDIQRIIIIIAVFMSSEKLRFKGGMSSY